MGGIVQEKDFIHGKPSLWSPRIAVPGVFVPKDYWLFPI